MSDAQAHLDDEETANAPLLKNRDFQILLVGDAVSTFGSRMSSLAFPLLAFSISRDPLLVGAVSAAGMVAMLVVGLPAGTYVNKRSVMVASALVASVACVMVIALLGADLLTIEVLALCAFAIGCCDSIYDPANTAAVQRVVPKGQLSTAYAIEQGRNGVAGLAGPPAAGVPTTTTDPRKSLRYCAASPL